MSRLQTSLTWQVFVAFLVVKSPGQASLSQKFSYKSNDLILCFDFDGRNLVLCTKKFIKIYTYNKKKAVLKEKSKIELFVAATDVKIIKKDKETGGLQFLTSFTDGTVNFYQAEQYLLIHTYNSVKCTTVKYVSVAPHNNRQFTQKFPLAGQRNLGI